VLQNKNEIKQAAAAILRLGPLIRFCILGPSSFSSWTSVPSGFSVQYHLFLVSEARVPCVVPLLHSGSSPCRLRSIPSAVCNFPGSEISWRLFTWAVPLLHDATPSCRRQPTSSGINSLLGSVPLALRVALRLDSGPYVASLALCQFSLRHVPWGPPDAPLQIPCTLKLAPCIPDVSPSFLGRHAVREWIAASSSEISCRFTTVSFSPGFGSVFFGLTSVASWQAVLSFDHPSRLLSKH
jgi:hypothetical protein